MKNDKMNFRFVVIWFFLNLLKFTVGLVPSVFYLAWHLFLDFTLIFMPGGYSNEWFWKWDWNWQEVDKDE